MSKGSMVCQTQGHRFSSACSRQLQASMVCIVRVRTSQLDHLDSLGVVGESGPSQIRHVHYQTQ